MKINRKILEKHEAIYIIYNKSSFNKSKITRRTGFIHVNEEVADSTLKIIRPVPAHVIRSPLIGMQSCPHCSFSQSLPSKDG